MAYKNRNKLIIKAKKLRGKGLFYQEIADHAIHLKMAARSQNGGQNSFPGLEMGFAANNRRSNYMEIIKFIYQNKEMA